MTQHGNRHADDGEPGNDEIDLGDLVEEIAGAGVIPIDDQPDPKVVPAVDFYVYRAQRAAMRAIRLQSRSDGLGAATEAQASAARLDAAAGLAEERVRHGNVQIQTLDRLINKAYTVLGSWQGRSWWDTRRKLAFWAIVLVADTGTIAGIAYSVGDPLFLAIPFGLGAGASAVTLGLLASDQRKHKERARRADHQPERLRRVRRLLRGRRTRVAGAGGVRRGHAGPAGRRAHPAHRRFRRHCPGRRLRARGHGLVPGQLGVELHHTCEIRDYSTPSSGGGTPSPPARTPSPHHRRPGPGPVDAESIVAVGILTGKAGAQAAKARIIAGGPMQNPAVYGHGTALPTTAAAGRQPTAAAATVTAEATGPAPASHHRPDQLRQRSPSARVRPQSMRYPVTTLPRTRTVTVPARSDVDHHHLDTRIHARLGPAGHCPDGEGRATHVLLFDDSASSSATRAPTPPAAGMRRPSSPSTSSATPAGAGGSWWAWSTSTSGRPTWPPTAVATRPGLVAVHEALRVPDDGAGVSTIGPALAEAAGFPGPLTTLAILSDFALTDTDVVTDLLAARPAWVDHVHLVSLGLVPSFTGDIVPPWVTVTRLGHRPGQFADAVHRSFTRPRLPSRRTS